MKDMLFTWKAISFIVICFIILSCNNSKAGFWEDYSHVYNQNGEVKDYTLEKGKPYVINFATLSAAKYVLYHTPKGKIDTIINSNPDWEFVFYCECEPSDSLELMGILKRYNCHFPVIVDPEGSWPKKELNHHYDAIGVICDKEGNILDVSVIGTTQSFFDQKFSAAKRQISNKYNIVKCL